MSGGEKKWWVIQKPALGNIVDQTFNTDVPHVQEQGASNPHSTDSWHATENFCNQFNELGQYNCPSTSYNVAKTYN